MEAKCAWEPWVSKSFKTCACYQACCFSAAVASLFCPRSGSRWLPFSFPFPSSSLLCFMAFAGHLSFLLIISNGKPPSWESNEPKSQAKQLPSKGLASCSSRASKSMASPKMHQKHLLCAPSNGLQLNTHEMQAAAISQNV